jgi:hypothetical protein
LICILKPLRLADVAAAVAVLTRRNCLLFLGNGSSYY